MTSQVELSKSAIKMGITTKDRRRFVAADSPQTKEASKMPRSRSRCRLVSALTLFSCSSAAIAFTTPLHRITRKRAVLPPPKADSVGLLHYDDDSIDPSDPTSSWMRWMSGGVKPARTVQREPDERTGGTGNDRYSSKDWWHTTVTYVSFLHKTVQCVSCY
jgi:hypothetical protein